jgi:hypothetical protein
MWASSVIQTLENAVIHVSNLITHIVRVGIGAVSEKNCRDYYPRGMEQPSPSL